MEAAAAADYLAIAAYAIDGSRAMLIPIEGKSFFCLATGMQEVLRVSRRAELERCVTRRRVHGEITSAPVNRSLGSIELARGFGSPLKSLHLPRARLHYLHPHPVC